MCLQMSVMGFVRDCTVRGFMLKPVCLCAEGHCEHRRGKRLSVTSKPDSLITNAAKDLLVYQSEPQALPLPSGDGSYYHEPIGPCAPDTPLAPAWSHQGRPKPPLISLHACTSSDTVHAYRLYPGFFLVYTNVHLHPSLEAKNAQKETYVGACIYILECICFTHTDRQIQIHKIWTTKASMWAMNLLCFETKA